MGGRADQKRFHRDGGRARCTRDVVRGRAREFGGPVGLGLVACSTSAAPGLRESVGGRPGRGPPGFDRSRGGPEIHERERAFAEEGGQEGRCRDVLSGAGG